MYELLDKVPGVDSAADVKLNGISEVVSLSTHELVRVNDITIQGPQDRYNPCLPKFRSTAAAAT